MHLKDPDSHSQDAAVHTPSQRPAQKLQIGCAARSGSPTEVVRRVGSVLLYEAAGDGVVQEVAQGDAQASQLHHA